MQSAPIADKKDSCTLEVALHPLVIINVSDHWTRARVTGSEKNPRVIGAVLGTQKGREIEIFNSFELIYDVIDGEVIIDFEYFVLKQEQFKKVYPTYDFLGWYSTQSQVQPTDIGIHKQMITVNESPLYMVLNTSAAGHPGTKELPIEVFDTELHMVNNEPTMLFVKVPYKIQTGEAERIGVDHVAHVTPSGGADGSQFNAHMVGIHNAVKMLNLRVKMLVKYLEEVKKGTVPVNQALLRHIFCLVNLLPAIDTPTFREEFLSEYNDVLLTAYLASMTKSTNTINELVEKFNIAFDRHSRRRGFF